MEKYTELGQVLQDPALAVITDHIYLIPGGSFHLSGEGIPLLKRGKCSQH